MKNFKIETAIVVNQTPQEVFYAINNVEAWWSGEVVGDSRQLGNEFTYRVPGAHFSKQVVTTFTPSTKIVWHVTDASLSFVKNKSEWVGTNIVFEIERKGAKTEVVFKHEGLHPQFECYSSCSSAWHTLINKNLKQLIATGVSQPSPWA